MTERERAEYDAALIRLREQLDEGALSAARAEGRQMTADAAVVLALSR